MGPGVSCLPLYLCVFPIIIYANWQAPNQYYILLWLDIKYTCWRRLGFLQWQQTPTMLSDCSMPGKIRTTFVSDSHWLRFLILSICWWPTHCTHLNILLAKKPNEWISYSWMLTTRYSSSQKCIIINYIYVLYMWYIYIYVGGRLDSLCWAC